MEAAKGTLSAEHPDKATEQTDATSVNEKVKGKDSNMQPLEGKQNVTIDSNFNAVGIENTRDKKAKEEKLPDSVEYTAPPSYKTISENEGTAKTTEKIDEEE